MGKTIFLNIRYKHFISVHASDILLIEGADDYSRFVTTTGSYLLKSTLTLLEKELPAEDFCRINRSCIVPLAKITSIVDDIVHVNEREIPLAKKYQQQLFDRLTTIR
jgi:DNA-binding LytR/AlgR family response regulator